MGNCSCCLRAEECVLRRHAEATLPFAQATLGESALSEYDRELALGRVLRGNGGTGSPGFVEEAILDQVMTRGEIEELRKELLKVRPENAPAVSLDELCRFCRHYQGPADSPKRDR